MNCRAQTRESRLFARAVVRFAVSLGKTTTAEGVETREQLDILRAEACVEMQGYYFSRPIPGAEIAPILLGQVQKAAKAHGSRAQRRSMAIAGG